jgi:hypothetical protein
MPSAATLPRPLAFDEPVPLRFHRLQRSEQLTLWCVRAIALGHAECPSLHRALDVALGSSAEEAFAALFTAVRTLGWCARRRFRLHAPGCDGVSEDEEALLALFSEAQAALSRGDERAVRARLQDWVEPRLLEGLLMTVQAVAGALEVNGYALPDRTEAARTLCSAGAVLH